MLRVCVLLSSTFKHDVRTNARAMMKLMTGADMAKHTLSTLESANCFVDSLHDGIDFECTVSRWVSAPDDASASERKISYCYDFQREGARERERES